MTIFFADQGDNFMKFNKGDLIVLDKVAGIDFFSTGWRNGTNDRSGKTGDFPTEISYVLPTLAKPPQDIVVSNLYAHYFLILTVYLH